MKGLPGRGPKRWGNPVVWFWHGEGQDHVTWALRSPTNTVRELCSLYLMTVEPGVLGAPDLPLSHR